jgi:hypothetical protein
MLNEPGAADATVKAEMEVTPSAAPPIAAAAAAPVTRLFRVTPVLSMGQTLSEANSVAGVSNS